MSNRIPARVASFFRRPMETRTRRALVAVVIALVVSLAH